MWAHYSNSHDEHCGYSNPHKHCSYSNTSDECCSYSDCCDKHCSYSNPRNGHCSYWTREPTCAGISCPYIVEEINKKNQFTLERMKMNMKGHRESWRKNHRKRRGAINSKQLTYLEKYRPKQRLRFKDPHNHKNKCCIM